MNFAWHRIVSVLSTALAAVIYLCALQALAATPCCDGTLWLKTSEEARTAYVDGYIEGLLRGFGKGCFAGTKGIKATERGPDADPFHKCLQDSLSFSRTSSEYATAITEFYQKYPDDRDMRVPDVLIKLSQGLTPEKIHVQRKSHADAAHPKDDGLHSQMRVAESGT